MRPVGVEVLKSVQKRHLAGLVLRKIYVGQMSMYVGAYRVEGSLDEIVICVKVPYLQSLRIPGYRKPTRKP